MRKIIQQRKRIYIAVEGEGEQSFIKWLQLLADQRNLYMHLDCQLLGGGGYKPMLYKAVRQRERKDRCKAKSSILLVDSDRDERGDDGWSLSRLKEEANKQKITVCAQNPNQEGLLLRMMKAPLKPSAGSLTEQLRRRWPDYQKPVNAQTLASKFSLDNLLHVAHVDLELETLLSVIGFSIH